MNILITSASRKVALIRAFKQALRLQGGGIVIAVDVSPLSGALYEADSRYLVPASTDPDFLAAILRLCSENSVKLLVPTRDEELLFFAQHKKEFAGIGTVIMVPDADTVKVCQDKKLFIEFCLKHQFFTPKNYQIDALEDNKQFPLFVKPRYGKGGKQALRVDSRHELLRVISSVAEPIVQEYIQAPEYTVDLFMDFSGQAISAVPRQRIQIFGGESFVSKTVKCDSLINESIRLASAMRLLGHNTIQCFLDGGIVKFIEVNPRFGGAANLGFAAGALTPLFLVKLLKGEALEPAIGKFKENYVMLRYTEDLFLAEEDLTEEKFT